MDLPYNTSGLGSEWFYIAYQKPALQKRIGHRPEKVTKWDVPLCSRKTEDHKELSPSSHDLKK
jgi:hypothetical protein